MAQNGHPRSRSITGLSMASTTSHQEEPQIETPPLMSHQEIRAPGGFRRSFLLHRYSATHQSELSYEDLNSLRDRLPQFNHTKHEFNQMLQLYGHFAGLDLSDDESNESSYEEEEETAIDDESISLLPRRRFRPHQKHAPSATTTTPKAILLLLKSFIGSGVLFLPKAFANGGYLFSLISMIICSLFSYGCFVLLLSTKDKCKVSGYGDLGNLLYGRKLEICILLSIVLSQIGFAAVYIVFTATNLISLAAVFFPDYAKHMQMTFFIVFQTILFIPLSFTRNIAKLSSTAIIANFLIFLGLLYLYSYPIHHLIKYGPAKGDEIMKFNPKDWTLFIGTAIFTYEGIGLLIPIQESMKNKEHFHNSLIFTMVVVTLVFISMGLIGYFTFGGDVNTVILENFPQDSILTSLIQLFYSIAILLSSPLQLFPAIKILENWTFSKDKSGKYNKSIKWAKNYFRSICVIVTALIAFFGSDDLNKFVSLIGAFACVPLIYIYPPLLHFKASQIDKTLTFKWAFLDWCIGIFGLIMMIYTTYQTIILWTA